MQKIAILFMLGAVLGGTVCAQEAQHAELVLQDIVGIVLYPDGQTPVEKLPVRLWDVERGKVVYKTSTDANGFFRIPSIKTGEVYVYIGRVKVDLNLMEKPDSVFSQQHTIVVVLSRSLLYGRHPVDVLPWLTDLLIAAELLQQPEPPRVVSP